MVNTLLNYSQTFSGNTLLSEVEERKLIVAAVKGNINARNKLVQAHIPLVFSIAKKIAKDSVYEDVVQSGIVGLVLAANRVNSNFNNRFSTYAAYYIKNEINEYIRLCTKAVKLPAKNPAIANDPIWNPVYFDKCINQDGDSAATLLEFLEDTASPNPETQYLLENLHDILMLALKNVLTAVERRVILDYFGFNGESLSFSQIGKNLGYTRQGANEIANRALSKLKNYITSHYDVTTTYWLSA